MLDRLDGADAARVRAAITENIARRGGADTLVVSDYAPDHALEGRSLAEIADARSVSPVDLSSTLLQQGDASLVSFNMSDDDIVRIMRQPWTMTCSDGELTAPGPGQAASARLWRLRAEARGLRSRSPHHRPAACRSVDDEPPGSGLRPPRPRRDSRRRDRRSSSCFDPAQVQDRATYREPQQIADRRSRRPRERRGGDGRRRADGRTRRPVGAAGTVTRGENVYGCLFLPSTSSSGSSSPPSVDAHGVLVRRR